MLSGRKGAALEHDAGTASPDDLGCRHRYCSAVLLQGLTDPGHPQELDWPDLGKLPPPAPRVRTMGHIISLSLSLLPEAPSPSLYLNLLFICKSSILLKGANLTGRETTYCGQGNSQSVCMSDRLNVCAALYAAFMGLGPFLCAWYPISNQWKGELHGQ